MNTLRRYWIVELTLALVAIAALGFGIWGTVDASQQAAPSAQSAMVATPTLVANEAQLAAAQQAAGLAANEDDDAFFDDDAFEDDEFDDDDSGFELEDDDDEEDKYEEDEYEEECDDEHDEDYEDDIDHLTIVADAIGIEPDALEAELLAGRSVAEVSAENNVDVSTVIDAVVAAEFAVVDAEEAEGEISAEEAAEWRAEIEQFVPFYINTPYVDPEVVAAQAIGIELDTFFEALDDGQSVADIAADNGVEPEAVAEAVVSAESAFIDKMVAADLIDATEAAEWKAEFEEEVDELLYESDDD